MGLIETFRGFHWVTRMVIACTVLLLGLLTAAIVTGVYWMSHQEDTNVFALNQGLGQMVLSLGAILLQVFLLIGIAVAIYMAAMAFKTWMEKYLDAVLAKLDTLTGEKSRQEDAHNAVFSMNERVARMERKLDNIERILEKVSD